MKKPMLASIVLLFFATLPADAQFLRRPFVQRVIHSPVVHSVVEAGVAHYLPVAGQILHDANRNLESRSADSKIYVDSSVPRNLDSTKSNLKDAEEFLKKLKEKYQQGGTSGTTSPATGTLPPSVRHATRQELEDELRRR